MASPWMPLSPPCFYGRHLTSYLQGDEPAPRVTIKVIQQRLLSDDMHSIDKVPLEPCGGSCTRCQALELRCWCEKRASERFVLDQLHLRHSSPLLEEPHL